MKTRIAEIIRGHGSFEIITHERPDEDAVGASRALGLALASLGKSVELVYPTPVPDSLDFTDAPGATGVESPEISILVDVSDLSMLRGTIPRGTLVVIDHHRTAGNIGLASWIDSEMSSASEMIYDLLEELGVKLTASMAANLYMGVFGDTGGFIHANTTARVFEIVRRLTMAGADPNRIAYRIKKTKALGFYRILAAVMNRMVVKDGLFASYIAFEEIARLGAVPDDTSGVVEEMSCIAGSNLVIFLKELQAGVVSCSIRSKIPDAALRTAQAFGGGGHGLAAGFTIKGRPEAIMHAVIEEGIKWL
jgi:phosphoesterase RecJ-like protein